MNGSIIFEIAELTICMLVDIIVETAYRVFIIRLLNFDTHIKTLLVKRIFYIVGARPNWAFLNFALIVFLNKKYNTSLVMPKVDRFVDAFLLLSKSKHDVTRYLLGSTVSNLSKLARFPKPIEVDLFGEVFG